MRYKEAVRIIQKLGAENSQHAINAEQASQRYSAHMTLFNVAASNGNEKEMEDHRLTIHACVDAILDAGMSISRNNREIRRVSEQAEPE